MFALLGFLLPAAAPIPTEAIDAPKIEQPVFKWKWWYQYRRLDARPTIWSLDNRPEEWRWQPGAGNLWLQHIPSRHSFSYEGYMHAPECGCSSYQKFQWGQRRKLINAIARCMNRLRAATQREFQSHFINSLENDGQTSGIQT